MPSFRDCVVGELAARRFGKARSDVALDRYDGLVEQFTRSGHAMPENAAASKMLKEIDFDRRERKRVKVSNLRKFAEWGTRIDEFNRTQTITGKGQGDSGDFSMAVRAGISQDQRAQSLSTEAHQENVRSELYNVMGVVMAKVSKGLLGRQKGKAVLRSFTRELDGVSTGNAAAKELAAGWRAATDAVWHLWRESGGSMNKVDGVYLPEPETSVRLVRAGEDAWVNDANSRIDWERTTWPNGRPVAPAERDRFLRAAWRTKASGGANKLDRAGLRGQAEAFGNLLNQHRLIHYRSSVKWEEMYRKYNDGNMLDMIVNYLDDTSNKIGILRVWGSSPQLMYGSVKARAVAAAEKLDASGGGAPSKKRTAVSRTSAQLKKVVDPMFEVLTRRNSMDPESVFGQTVTATGNVITSAFLGQATFLAVPGDFVTTISARMATRYGSGGAFDGMGFYLQALLTDPAAAERISLQTGFVMDETLSSMYAMMRYTAAATYGPALSRRIADVTLRASLLTPHTKAARYAVRMEQMAFLAHHQGTRFSEHPMREIFKRYGIEEADWNEFRGLTIWSPNGGRTKMLRPMDMLNTGLAPRRRRELFNKFQGMIWEESRNMILDAKIEGATRLKDTTRPDTLPGALLYSVGMFKSFPMSFVMSFSRIAMALETRGSRLTMLAGVAAGMTLAGALGTQTREVATGRDFMAMDDPRFWGKAFLSGGALGVFGDFLFANINRYGSGPEDVAAGPLTMFAGDLTQLFVQDIGYNWIGGLTGLNDNPPETPVAAKLTQFASQYTPGSTIWWGKLLLQRELFDRMQVLADPRAYQKFRRRVRNRKEDFGQDYFSAPGSRIFENGGLSDDLRAPSFERIFDGDR